ncbi:MAG: 7-carboxy-7-deazaguanine synthase QueE [Bryobacteraceae bacterium]|nr:7-carboxy-7-deazaguanine synthase QueE [Bryobacteraceae bacterium]
MKISELFYSLQGEGQLLGVPSFFIRTTGCNLRCTWCDTPYTSWAPVGEEMTVEQIVAEALRHAGRHAVVTGGEPLIAPAIGELTAALRAAGFHITIETAGTVAPPVACDLMSISPKLSNSTPWERDEGRYAAQHERLRYQPEVLRELMRTYNYQLKFVVTSPEDLVEIRALLQETGGQASKTILMPEGIQLEILRERARWISEACKQENFRYSPRLHIDLFGNTRGT